MHIPANTYFLKIGLEDDCIKNFIVSDEPKMCLLADSTQDKYYRVMLDNDFWFVKKTDVFLNTRERSKKDDRT